MKKAMKTIKLLLTLVLAVTGRMAFAQDLEQFNNPFYEKYGESLEERRDNYLHLTFLKESVTNRQYDEATEHLEALLAGCPSASENIYGEGIKLYRAKIARSKTLQEKRGNVDTLMMLYDLRNQYFGSHPTRGTVYILAMKARELFNYNSSDREGIRKAFEEAIDAEVSSTGKADPELMALYFQELCEDYKNDEVEATDILAAYERLAPMFAGITADQEKHRTLFEGCFGLSGAASCENLEDLFSKKLDADPDNVSLLSQAVSLMSRANCDSDFYFNTAEHYYEVNPSADTALFLAQAFQNRKEFDKANNYLREALKSETDPAERVKLLVRIAVVELAAYRYSASAAAAEEACSIDPENGYGYFILAQAYASGNSSCEAGLARDSYYWLAYDTMNKAVQYLENEPDTKKTAQETLSRYRRAFPTKEECFFNELSENSSYTLDCGIARGKRTTVRFRPE